MTGKPSDIGAAAFEGTQRYSLSQTTPEHLTNDALRAMRKSIKTVLRGRGISWYETNDLAHIAYTAFGGDTTAFTDYQGKIVGMWANGGWSTLQPQSASLGLILREALAGLEAAGVTPQTVEYAPYVSMAFVTDPMTSAQDGWVTLLDDLRRVPVAYLEGAYTQRMPDGGSNQEFLRTVVECWDRGLSESYAKTVPLYGLRTRAAFRQTGYKLEEALRLQGAGVAASFARMVFQNVPDHPAECVLKLAEAGVSEGYATALLGSGLAAEDIITMHREGVPLEYAKAVTA